MLLTGLFCDRASGGKLVDASPAIEKHLTDELEKVARVYGAKGDEFTKFPTFNFTGSCHFVTFSYEFKVDAGCDAVAAESF